MVKKQVKKLMGFWSEERGLSLFLTILVIEMFVILPMVRAGFLLGLASDLLFSLLLLAGVLTVLQHRALQWVAGVLVALAIAFKWANMGFGTTELSFLNGVLSLAAALTFLLIVLWSVFREGPVTRHRILGAIAAYLLLAVCFSFAYDLVAYADPGAFTTTGLDAQKPQARTWAFLYFSVVTLTTVGFGDIAAVHPAARSLVMLEAIIGTLYPAILLARLVTLEIETRRTRHAKKDVHE
jgi:hypothetical protein